MRNRNKNIYMGRNSTARLPVFGKVDTGNEICLNAIATAYDALNNKMLTRRLGVFDKTTPVEVNSRFSILRILCRKHAPEKLATINRIYSVISDNLSGRISDNEAFMILQNISEGCSMNPNFLNEVAMHIDTAEMFVQPPMQSNDPMAQFFSFFINSNKKKRRV